METIDRRQYARGIIALLLALLLVPAAPAARAQDNPKPTPAAVEPSATAAVPSEAGEFFVEDLGPATLPIDSTAPITDTILAALADYRAAEKAATLDTIEDVFGSTVPDRPKAVEPRIYLPLLAGRPAEAQPGPVEPGPVEPRPKSANVTAVVWPSPSIRVARDGTLAYEIRLYNDGEGSARSTRVTMPYDRTMLTPIGSRLDQGAGDWVSELRPDAVVVTFGELGAKKMRTGWVYFRVASYLADNTVLSMRPTFQWSDARGTTSRTSNWAPVLVGGGNDSGAYVWTIVQPVTGLPNELRTFYSNRFAPGEVVTTWLNTPTGVMELDIHETVDQQGQVWVEYRPSRLAPASYQLVIYGNRSRLVGVATFIVQ